MKALVVTAIILAGCGGNEEQCTILVSSLARGPELPPQPDAWPYCLPVTQLGCNAGEKCTWISDQDEPSIGHIGCAPDFTTMLDAPCDAPVAGPRGYDICAAGRFCQAGACRRICDTASATGCQQNTHCAASPPAFVDATQPGIGICVPD
ncbi:MAG TPA: hypothetical protein VGM90_21400 [Kofleriaceae bacterium]|jgi:hypothetical protein